MGTTTTWEAIIVSGLACFELLGTPRGVAAQDTPKVALQVLLVNRADAPSDVLLTAQTTAARIYSALDIDVRWVRAGEDAFSAANVVTLVVTPKVLPGATRHALGTAIANRSSAGRRAYVYLDRVAAFAALTNSNVSSVLGHVIAHEMGHLLIGNNSHALTGLMSSRWSRAEMERLSGGGLAFTDDLAKTIQARLMTFD